MSADVAPRPLRQSDHHYVIVVHGTFNKPEPDKPHWAAIDPADPQNFARRLDEHLAGTPIGSTVNRMPGGERHVFVWSGGNTDRDRREGGRALAAHIDGIVTQDPNARIHLVGHSHGGNVILSALEYYYTYLQQKADHHSSIPWVLWRLGDATGGFLNNQPTDLHEPARKLVGRISHEDETLRSTVLRSVTSLVLESDPSQDPADPEATEYRRYYCASPTTNRLGRIVFLGTPFFQKRWRSRNPLEWLLDLVFNSAGLVLYWGIVGYVITVVLLAVPWLVLEGGFPWNPMAWPLAVQLLYATYVAWNTYVGYQGDVRRNGNVYWNRQPIERYSLHEPVFLASIKKQCDGRLPALTVTAPHLDEALLGLVSEPLLLGRLRPELRRFLAPDWIRGREWSDASGLRSTRMTALRKVLSFGFQRLKTFVLAAVYFAIKLPWRVAYDFVLQRFILKAVFGAISSTASGLPNTEYEGAIIEPSERANVPELLNETVLDVTGVFLSDPPAPERLLKPNAQSNGEYAFLADDVILDRELAHDTHWQTISQQLDTLARFYQRADITAFSGELARRWLAIRVRATSILENITLNHGRYYADDRVVKAIAEFIANGKVSSLATEPNLVTPRGSRDKKKTGEVRVFRFEARQTSMDAAVVRSIPAVETPSVSPEKTLQALASDFVACDGKAITRGFVTCGQFRIFAESFGERSEKYFFFPEHWRGLSTQADHDDDPVGGVRASDAALFCVWLGSMCDGELTFRLPTPREARQVRASSEDRLCWCESERHGRTCVGAPSYRSRYRESLVSLAKSGVPFPRSGFGGLSARSPLTHININAPPVDPLIVHLISRGVFNRLGPQDLYRLPTSLHALATLIEDVCHTHKRTVDARAYAAALLDPLLEGLAEDPYPQCASAYRNLRMVLDTNISDALVTLEALKTEREPTLSHTAWLVGDMIRALQAPTDVDAFAWLQVGAARALEYAWHAHDFLSTAERQVAGRWRHIRETTFDRVTGRGASEREELHELWQSYWWLRFAIARGNGTIPPLEGIRVVCEWKHPNGRTAAPKPMF